MPENCVMKLHRVVPLLTAILLMSSQVPEVRTFSVSGTVSRIKADGILYVRLFSRTAFENESDAGFSFSKRVKKKDEDVSFCFENVPAGMYAVRCFLDKNENGIIDMGLFGPKEPYGFCMEKSKISRPPEFNELSFDISGNLDGIRIVLK